MLVIFRALELGTPPADLWQTSIGGVLPHAPTHPSADLRQTSIGGVLPHAPTPFGRPPADLRQTSSRPPADLQQIRSPRTFHHLRRPRGPFFASGGFISTASGRPPAANLYRWRALLQSSPQRLWQTSSRPPADTFTSNIPSPPADLRQTRSPRTFHHLRRPRGLFSVLLGYVSQPQQVIQLQVLRPLRQPHQLRRLY